MNDEQAMREALELAVSPDAPFGENPRVGCVIVRDTGLIIGRGHHRGAGTPHAEIEALQEAGERAAGATAVVTLEPCRHTGRTGPCVDALIDAGVARVVFGQTDPTPDAGGGAAVLVDAGIEVVGGVLADEAQAVNAQWTFAVTHGRPFVTWKAAVSLDGRVSGPDGGPTMITGEAARADVHRLRSRVGAIVVGTGTALIDDPSLTVRLGEEQAAQPLRVVVGSREIPATAKVRDAQAPTLLLDAEPEAVLDDLYGRGVRHVLLEGGPTLAAAFLDRQLIDEVVWYVAPIMLASGTVALPASAADRAVEVDVSEVAVIGEDVRITGLVRYQRAEP